MKISALSNIPLLLLIALMMSSFAPFAAETDTGGEYTVKNGEWLRKLARVHLGNSEAFQQIIDATNAKAAEDPRFTRIEDDSAISPGQLIWLPQLAKPSEASKPSEVAVSTPIVIESGIESGLESRIEPVVKNVAKTAVAKKVKASAKPKVTLVTLPKNNCQIKIWYNYQVVGIPAINKRWIEEGVRLEERALRAFELRHDARMTARFMMVDKEEVYQLRKKDKQDYGHPDGPTFSYVVTRGQSAGLKGNHIYEAIIEGASRVTPVYESECE